MSNQNCSQNSSTIAQSLAETARAVTDTFISGASAAAAGAAGADAAGGNDISDNVFLDPADDSSECPDNEVFPDDRDCFLDFTRGLPDDKEKDNLTMFYCGEEVKFKKKEVDAVIGSSMVLLLKVDVDGDFDNDAEKREQMLRLRQKYVNAAEKHNAAVSEIIDNGYVNGYADSGFDLYVPFDQDMVCGEFGKKINFRVQCAAYEDEYTPTGYYVYPRSSISKTPLRLANSVGIIDSGYRGNLLGAFDCHRVAGSASASDIYPVKTGVRLVQICAPNLQPFLVKVVDKLDDTTRGAGGFGSTGV